MVDLRIGPDELTNPLCEEQHGVLHRVPQVHRFADAGVEQRDDATGEVLEAGPAHRVTRKDADAFPQALEADRVEGVAVAIVDGLAGRLLGHEHQA